MRRFLPVGALKESFDNLPEGLCFAKKNGIPVMINKVMHSLSHAVTGQALQNAEFFWQTLYEGELKNGAERVIYGDQPVIRLTDGTYRTFSRCAVNMEGIWLSQITATDTTDLHCLAEQLRENNEALRTLGMRLRSYNESITELTKREELLSAKIKLHDDIGQTLARTRYALSSSFSLRSAEVAIRGWKRITDNLRPEIERKKEPSAVEYLISTAEAVGVKLTINGSFPSSGRNTELLVAVASEALTNAVKHARATEMTVDIIRNPSFFNVIFTNDGDKPEKKAVEGGGLSNIRSRVERVGGEVFVATSPEFKLSLRIPATEVES